MTIYQNTLYSIHVINRGYDINRGDCLRKVVINIRASKNISGLIKVSVTSPAGLLKFFLNVEHCNYFGHYESKKFGVQESSRGTVNFQKCRLPYVFGPL